MTPTRSLDWRVLLPLAACLAQPAFAAPDAAVVARDNWREFMSRNPAAEPGCFHASYPNYLWEKAECQTLAQPHVHPVRRQPAGGPAITSLHNLTLSGSAVAGGNDNVVFNNGTQAYSISGADSVVNIASVWRQSEFNVVGNAGGSRANFNSGSSVAVKIALSDGSTAAPGCVAGAGSTAETNNLNLGPCTASAGSTPSVQFTESN